MTDFNVTFVVKIAQSDNVQEGDIVSVVPEPDNLKDPMALRVVNAAGEQIGYVANSPKTVRKGTMSASQAYKLVSSTRIRKAVGRCSAYKRELFGPEQDEEMTTFVLSLFFVPNRKVKAEKEFDAPCFGGVVSAPGNGVLKAELKKAAPDGCKTEVEGRLIPSTTSDVINFETRFLRMSDGELKLFAAGDDESACEWVAATVLEKKDQDDLIAFVKASNTIPCTAYMNDKGKICVKGKYASMTKELDVLADRIIEQCIEQEKTIQDKIKFMKDSNIPPIVIAKVLEDYRRYDDENEARIPAPKSPFIQDDSDPVLTRALSYHIHGKHIRLIGDKGCGKNTLVETVCWLMRKPLLRISGSSEIDKTDLLGSMTLDNGSMHYQLSDMLKVLASGGDVDLDEANTIKPEVEVVLHSLTDEARSIEVPGYGLVKMDSKSIVMITMNEDYVGCGTMNDATVDRFMPIRMQPAASITGLLAYLVPKANKADIATCQRVYTSIRACISKNELSSSCISIRGFKDALDCSDLVPLIIGLTDGLAHKSQDEEERATMRNIINNECAGF